MEVALTGRWYPDAPKVIESYREIWMRLGALPGVTAAGGVSMLLLTRETPRVVIVDDHMAGVLWPNEDPIGKRLRRGGMDADADAPWLTVVGVVARIKQYTLDERDSRIAMYHPHTQAASRSINIVVRAAAPETLAAAAAGAIRAIDPDLPIYNVKTMERRVDESLARRRFAMLLLTLFAGVALVLACVGIYGVMAYLVHQGQRDLGIRMALGASPGRIVALVVRHGATVAAVGITIGVAGALVVADVMRNLLFGIEPVDAPTFAAGALLLAAVAIAGSYVPARRAAKIDPAVAFRTE